jgi:hypothetical protein
MSSLKAIVKHLVERVGGAKQAAKLLGVSETEISYWCNPNHPRFIPVDHLVDLDAAGGHLFLKYLARQCGFDLIGSNRQADIEANVLHTLGDLTRSAGTLTGVMLEALSDQKYTTTEKRNTLPHLRPVKDSIDELERFLAS